MRLTEAVEATGGVLSRGVADTRFESVCTDSRKLRDDRGKGALFVALRGPNFDGHDFIDEAVRAGAVAIVCREGKAPRAGDTACIEVADPLAALGDLAAARRSSFDGPVVAITGSNGKTTTKEMLRAIMMRARGEEAVLANEGNLNNLIGMPMTLLTLRDHHEVVILEMGMNAFGEIARLTEIASPTHGLITCIGEAHLEGVGSIDGVAKAKGELFRGLGEGATAVVNVDDDLVVREAASFSGPSITFGEKGRVRAASVKLHGFDRVSFDLVDGESAIAVDLPLGGRHNVSNAVGAAALAIALDVPLDMIAEGLAAVVPPPMRLEALTLENGVVVVNDAYNANPSSLSAALECLQAGSQGRHIIVLGEMLELGDHADLRHRQAGEAAAKSNPVLLCVMGPHRAMVKEGALSAGLDEERVVVLDDHREVAAEVAGHWRAGDSVLVKGSRGAEMEKVVRALEESAG